jgi:uroporphyrinogen decarboxylase
LTSTPIKPVLSVLSGQAVTPAPIWLMRQAGRYLPEYRELRAKAGDFMTLCFTPELATEVTLQPIRRFGFDAAILFSDILVIPHALGQKLWFAEGEGPRLEKMGPADFARMSPHAVDKALAPISETVSRVRAALAPEVTLIGFAGAPWTVASYMIAGGSSSDSEDLRRFAATNPDDLDRLIDTLVEATGSYLVAQVKAGAEVLQLFESWASTLPAGLVERCSIAPIRRIIERVRRDCPSIPFIVFPRGAGTHLPLYAMATGTNALGIDYQTDLAWIRRHVPETMALQGNLDPMTLAVGGKAQQQAIASILAKTQSHPHIFNLGHGIRQETPLENVSQMIAQLRNLR